MVNIKTRSLLLISAILTLNFVKANFGPIGIYVPLVTQLGVGGSPREQVEQFRQDEEKRRLKELEKSVPNVNKLKVKNSSVPKPPSKGVPVVKSAPNVNSKPKPKGKAESPVSFVNKIGAQSENEPASADNAQGRVPEPILD